MAFYSDGALPEPVSSLDVPLFPRHDFDGQDLPLQHAAKKLNEALTLAVIVAEDYTRCARMMDRHDDVQQTLTFLEAAAKLQSSAQSLMSQSQSTFDKQAFSKTLDMNFSKQGNQMDMNSISPSPSQESVNERDQVLDISQTELELLNHCTPQDVPRTLVVHGIGQLGINTLGCLRTHFKSFGDVDMVVEPKLRLSSRLALVVMKTAVGLETALVEGKQQRINGVVVSVSDMNSCLSTKW
eukprot:TRINITY_DN38403_c0_g1_i1.p1 TRINITY_DN38403_c0_g1~~TRINITY_DN38403_c0_g1_i1.p1  ORF type:complete len:240 (-),score=35.97 TRINITY_DN38403_c0_g1_i1:459-1178(-)